MAYPVDSAYSPNYDGSVTTYSGIYIPEIWSGKLVEKFYAATVFGEIANTDYEGEISAMGDQVNIRTVPNITITNYRNTQVLFYFLNNTPICNTCIKISSTTRVNDYKINSCILNCFSYFQNVL